MRHHTYGHQLSPIAIVAAGRLPPSQRHARPARVARDEKERDETAGGETLTGLSKGRRGAQANNKREARPDRSLRRLCISGAGAGADAVSGSVYATIHATVLASEAY